MNQLRLLLCLLTTSFFGSAQTIVLQDVNGDLLNNDTLTIITDYQDFDITFGIRVYNTSQSPKNINVTRFEEDVLPNTSSYYCWSVCTGVMTSGDFPEYTATGSVSVISNPNLSQNTPIFEFHHDPNYHIGTSLFRLRFYDIDNPSDSTITWCRLITTNTLGVSNLEQNERMLFPNPCTSVFTLSEADEPFELFIYDMAGNKVYSSNSSVNDVSHLLNGKYQVVIKTDNVERVEQLIINH